MSFYDAVREVIEGVHEAHKEKYRDWEYNHLTTTPFLQDDEYLEKMYKGARNKHEHECILDHLYRFDSIVNDGILDIPCYQKLEQKIVNKYWRG